MNKEHTINVILSALVLFFMAMIGYCAGDACFGAHSIGNISGQSASVQEAVKASQPAVIQTEIATGTARIVARSPKVFAYPHGTAMADGKMFIGMANKAGNPFPTNEIVIFDEADISNPTLVRVPAPGDIETMAYDPVNDKIYFPLSGNGSLVIYSLDPHTYDLSLIISTKSLDIGAKPAIVTDGAYIYGITNTNPSSVFKIAVDGTSGLLVNSIGHVPNGHSATIGVFASST